MLYGNRVTDNGKSPLLCQIFYTRNFFFGVTKKLSIEEGIISVNNVYILTKSMNP